jgi:hypothetical protein
MSDLKRILNESSHMEVDGSPATDVMFPGGGGFCSSSDGNSSHMDHFNSTVDMEDTPLHGNNLSVTIDGMEDFLNVSVIMPDHNDQTASRPVHNEGEDGSASRSGWRYESSHSGSSHVSSIISIVPGKHFCSITCSGISPIEQRNPA